jgi:sulfide dehydrogenase cytochrome subunit
MKIPVYAVISVLLMFATSAAGQDFQKLVEECEACHGAGGVSAEDDVPTLAGRDAVELLDTLDQFRFYERHCTTTTYRHGDRPKTPLNMCNVANTLSEDDRMGLAEYFAKQ